MSFILILSFISEVSLEGNLMHISLLQDAKLPMLFLEILFKFCKHWALVRGLPEFFFNADITMELDGVGHFFQKH